MVSWFCVCLHACAPPRSHEQPRLQSSLYFSGPNVLSFLIGLHRWKSEYPSVALAQFAWVVFGWPELLPPRSSPSDRVITVSPVPMPIHTQMAPPMALFCGMDCIALVNPYGMVTEGWRARVL